MRPRTTVPTGDGARADPAPSDRRGQSVPGTVPDSTLWHVGKAWLRTHVLIARVRGTMDGIVASVKSEVSHLNVETLTLYIIINIVVCTFQFHTVYFNSDSVSSLWTRT